MSDDKYKDALMTLIEDLAESGLAKEADQGADGYGPVATALIVLGYSFDEANIMIWDSLDDLGSNEELD